MSRRSTQMSSGQIACHRSGVLVKCRFAERVSWLFRCSEDLCNALILPDHHCGGLLKPTTRRGRLWCRGERAGRRQARVAQPRAAHLGHGQRGLGPLGDHLALVLGDRGQRLYRWRACGKRTGMLKGRRRRTSRRVCVAATCYPTCSGLGRGTLAALHRMAMISSQGRDQATLTSLACIACNRSTGYPNVTPSP